MSEQSNIEMNSDFGQKWELKLRDPIIVGTSFFGIEREEVIDRIIVGRCPPAVPYNSQDSIKEIAREIDWNRSDWIADHDLVASDLEGAIREAQADARDRAEIYCRMVRKAREGKIPEFRLARIRDHVRLVYSGGDGE